MKCHYDNETCEGPLWECLACRQSYCQAHGHNTSEGTNVECAACENIRFEEEDAAELAEILHCDWDHEADDVRRLPRGEDGAADWVCYEHYLREAETRDVLPWIALLSQSQEPEVVMARDLANVFLDLLALYRAGHQFRLVSVNHSHRPPNLQVDLTTLGCIVASTADITWEMSDYGNGDWNLQATANMFGVEFMALTKDLEIAEEWGCPKELLR